MNVKINTMAAVDLRQSVLAYVKNADNRFLKLVKALAESYQEDEIVAYTVEGTPAATRVIATATSLTSGVLSEQQE